MRFLGINLEIAQGVTVDHGGAVDSNFRCIVELPERVQTFVSFACVVKNDGDVNCASYSPCFLWFTWMQPSALRQRLR